ncbi:MAG: T9SS type A sorting domain-containing protein [Saprospiraceae bacterium]|nr:T9SS type A sorting domain-containing protein [Saprospiraceae bacterium]
MYKILISILLIFTVNKVLISQNNIFLVINPKLGEESFVLNKIGINNLQNKLSFTRIDYYLSGFIVIHDGGQETAFPNKYILVKGNKKINELLGSADITKVEAIQFSVGVEQPTNNGDPTLWPNGHPLSPQSPSMHWGWTAGYRFAAIEGKAGSNLTTLFQLHGLGNENYFSQKINVQSELEDNKLTIKLDADYQEAVNNIDVSLGPIDHGTNTNDLTMLRNFNTRVFKATTSSTGIKELNQITDLFEFFPNPNNTGIIQFKNLWNSIPFSLEIYKLSGEKIIERKMYSASINIGNLNKGIYMVLIRTHDKSISKKLIIL